MILQSVEKGINDLTVQQKFFEYRKARQNEGLPFDSHARIEVSSIGSKSLYISIGETLAVLVLTVWQVYYVKKMLDFRLSV